MGAKTEDLIKRATEAISDLKSQSIALPGTVQQSEDNFKKKLPLSAIKATITALEKYVAQLDSDITMAEKLKKEIDGKVKSKDLLNTVKEQKSLDTLKKVATDLDAQIKKSTADHKKFEGEYKVHKALMQTTEKDRAAEAKLGAELDKVIKEAKETSSDVNSKVIALPGNAGAVQELFDKSIPAPAIKAALTTFTRDVQEAGKAITTADSVSASLEGYVKKEKTFDLSDTLESVKEAKAVNAKLEDGIKKLRTLHGQMLTKATQFNTQFKQLAG